MRLSLWSLDQRRRWELRTQGASVSIPARISVPMEMRDDYLREGSLSEMLRSLRITFEGSYIHDSVGFNSSSMRYRQAYCS